MSLDLPVAACPACGRKNRLPAISRGSSARCGSCKEDLLAAPIDLSDTSFGWLNSVPAAVVDFWAPWCGPCVQFAPVFKQSAHASSVIHAKVNVDENPSTARRFQVSGIPTMVLLRNGTEVDRIVGAVSAGALKSALASLAE